MEKKAEYNIEKLRQEFAALRKYAAMESATQDTIGVKKIYIDMVGDMNAAMVLDELIFWTLPRERKTGLRIWKDGVLWLAVSRSEWWERKRLTEKQADLAIKKLIDQDLIVKQLYKFKGAPTVHIRLNIRVFFEKYSNALVELHPPEDEESAIEKDLKDLYEMMDFPQMSNSILPEGEKENAQNGNIFNSTHNSTHNNTTGANAPLPGGLEWKFAHDLPITEQDLQPDTFLQDAKDAAFLLAQKANADLEPLAIAFMQARHLLPALNDTTLKKWRAAFRQMKNARPNPVQAEHITEAVEYMLSNDLTISSPWSVVNIAIDKANPTPESNGYNPQGLTVQ